MNRTPDYDTERFAYSAPKQVHQTYTLGSLDFLEQGFESIPKPFMERPPSIHSQLAQELAQIKRREPARFEIGSDSFHNEISSSVDNSRNLKISKMLKPSYKRVKRDVEPSRQSPHGSLFLQCLNINCPYLFRSIEAWESHNHICAESQIAQESPWAPSLQCPFVSCCRIFASLSSLHDHYSQCHLVYVCSKPECRVSFDQESLAQKHNHLEDQEPRQSYVPQAFLSLEPKNWSLEEIRRGKRLSKASCIPYRVCFPGSRPRTPTVEDTELSIFPNEDLALSRSTSSTGSVAQPSTPELSSRITIEPAIMDSPGEPFHESSSFLSAIPSRSSSRDDRSGSIQAESGKIHRSYRATEPLAPTSLSFSEQKPYLQVLLNLCIKAAYTFYATYNLGTALDKKAIPIFLTKDKQVARLPYDLSLPQWTQHLRKACDTRHITEDMVYSLESFKGEIQPVDEVRHALSKEKIKSDRALLALIEAARTFVKQLKDWERCEMIDGIYEEVEMIIQMKKFELNDDAGAGNMDSILSKHPRRHTN